jgi:hypothetical protein
MRPALRCKQCGEPIVRRRVFCCDECLEQWYSENERLRDRGNRPTRAEYDRWRMTDHDRKIIMEDLEKAAKSRRAVLYIQKNKTAHEEDTTD